MKKYDTEWLIMSLKERKIEVTPLEEYINDETPILFQCKICKHKWKVDPSHLKGGRTCPNCKKLQKLEILKQEFINRAKQRHNNKYSYDKVVYTKLIQQVIITCPVHGDFKQSPNAHLRGQGCPKCAGNNYLRTTKEFIDRAKKVHGNKFDYSLVKYKTCKDVVQIKCSVCGHIFEQTPDGHLSGSGCPKCKLKSQRRLYELLKETFPNEVILFEVTFKTVPWLEKQRFDIYFPEYNIAIEYNGIQHYTPVEYFGGKIGFKKTTDRDKLKRQKCLDNKCALFEIKYNYSDNDIQNLIKNIKLLIYT